MAIDRKALDKAKARALWGNYIDDQDFLDGLWYEGQNDPLYSIHSSLFARTPEYLTKKIVKDAIYNQNLTLRDLKKVHYKGVSRADVAILKYATEKLKEIYQAMPDDGSEDYEED